MTLSEIKTKVPELQTKIADLAKKNEKDNKRLDAIKEEINEKNVLMEYQESQLKTCKDFIDKYKGNSSVQIQKKVDDAKKRRDTVENTIKGIKIEIRKLEDERDDIKKPDTDYAKRASEAEKVQKELDGICDILIQDPTINYHMQTAVMIKFDDEIEKEEKKKEKNQKAIENIRKGLKDGSKNGLKRTLEDLQEGNDKYNAARTDDSIDPVAALKLYKDASKIFISEVKTKYGVNIKQSDVDHIVEEIKKGNLDSLTITSLEKAMEKSDSVIKKLEESREKRLELIESKIAPDPQLTQEISDKQEEIDNITQEITDLTSEIDTMDAELATKDTEIADKESDLGEPSDDYKEFKAAEKELKDSHIVTSELLPDLDDENSVLRKRYELFKKSDLLVRKAFQNCKSIKDEAKRPDALRKLQEEIDRYQRISEDIASLSGCDIEAWQNYLLEELNDKIMDGETLDSAYYHTENESFKEMLFDKDTMGKHAPMKEYEAVQDSLKQIDSAQQKILKGDFSANVEELFTEKDNGYYDRMKDLDEAGKFSDVGCSVYDFIKGNVMIKRTVRNSVSRFFQKLFKGKTQKLFDTPKKDQSVIDRYKKANKESLKDEITGREELSNLKRERDAKKVQRDAKATTKVEKEEELRVAEEEKADLEAKSATQKAQSPIEASDRELRKMGPENDLVKEALNKLDRDDDGR